MQPLSKKIRRLICRQMHTRAQEHVNTAQSKDKRSAFGVHYAREHQTQTRSSPTESSHGRDDDLRLWGCETMQLATGNQQSIEEVETWERDYCVACLASLPMTRGVAGPPFRGGGGGCMAAYV